MVYNREYWQHYYIMNKEDLLEKSRINNNKNYPVKIKTNGRGWKIKYKQGKLSKPINNVKRFWVPIYKLEYLTTFKNGIYKVHYDKFEYRL